MLRHACLIACRWKQYVVDNPLVFVPEVCIHRFLHVIDFTLHTCAARTINHVYLCPPVLSRAISLCKCAWKSFYSN